MLIELLLAGCQFCHLFCGFQLTGDLSWVVFDWEGLSWFSNIVLFTLRSGSRSSSSGWSFVPRFITCISSSKFLCSNRANCSCKIVSQLKIKNLFAFYLTFLRWRCFRNLSVSWLLDVARFYIIWATGLSFG